MSEKLAVSFSNGSILEVNAKFVRNKLLKSPINQKK